MRFIQLKVIKSYVGELTALIRRLLVAVHRSLHSFCICNQVTLPLEFNLPSSAIYCAVQTTGTLGSTQYAVLLFYLILTVSSQRLDKPWSQVSSLLPPGLTCGFIFIAQRFRHCQHSSIPIDICELMLSHSRRVIFGTRKRPTNCCDKGSTSTFWHFFSEFRVSLTQYRC